MLDRGADKRDSERRAAIMHRREHLYHDAPTQPRFLATNTRDVRPPPRSRSRVYANPRDVWSRCSNPSRSFSLTAARRHGKAGPAPGTTSGGKNIPPLGGDATALD